MEFSEKLQTLRKQKELTQEELAQALFVSRTAISKWESGKGYPSIDSLKEISKYFSVTIDELLSSEELITAAQDDNRKNISNLRNFEFLKKIIHPMKIIRTQIFFIRNYIFHKHRIQILHIGILQYFLNRKILLILRQTHQILQQRKITLIKNIR